MANNIHTLTSAHQWFIDEKRHDPMTHKEFEIGDRVVVCANCKIVCKVATWDEMGKCSSCNRRNTQSQFITRRGQNEPLILGRNRDRQPSRTNNRQDGIRLVGDKRPYDGTSASRNTSARNTNTINRQEENARRLREQRYKTLRKVLYCIVIGLIIFAIGVLYSVIWFSNFSEYEEIGYRVLYVIAAIILLFFTVRQSAVFAKKDHIESNWNSFALGCFKSLGAIIVMYVAMYFFSWIMLSIANAIIG